MEDTADDVCRRRDLRHCIGAGGELLHQFVEVLVVAFLDEVRSEELRKLGSVVHLGSCQRARCT